MKSAIRQLLLLAAVAAILPAEAALASPADVIRDCADDGALQGSYPDSQLQRALNSLRGDVDEYTDCRAVIGAAIGGPGARASGRGGDADLNNDGKVTPAERRAAAKRRQRERERRELASIGGALGADGSVGGLVVDDTSNGLPLPLLLALIALASLGTAGGLWFAARRNPAVANALRRVPLPGRRG